MPTVVPVLAELKVMRCGQWQLKAIGIRSRARMRLSFFSKCPGKRPARSPQDALQLPLESYRMLCAAQRLTV